MDVTFEVASITSEVYFTLFRIIYERNKKVVQVLKVRI